MDEYFDFLQFCKDAVIAYPDNQLYCLADHAGMPGLHRELLRYGVQWASLFDEASTDAALAAAPLLFSLTKSSERLSPYFLRWLAQHATYTSSILMISSSCALGPLRARLRQRMFARASEGMDVLVRYFDPRVFESLIDVLDVEQRAMFLSPADCWWYLNRRGELFQEPACYAPDEIDSPLQLSAKQEFALLDASEIDQVASQLQSLLPDMYIGMGVIRRNEFLQWHITAASEFGIVATHEVALYCGLALLHGDDFAQSSPWHELLAEVATGSTGFSDAVAAQEEQS